MILVSGLDDRDDKNDLLTLEAMCSLSNVISVMNEDEVRPILMNVLLRIRPCFEKVKLKIINLRNYIQNCKIKKKN